jgi:serine/threonine-protein kinase
VVPVLAEYQARLPASERHDEELLNAMCLAELTGDFASAEALLNEHERGIATRNERALHFYVASLLTELYLETGREDRARVVAEEYLKRADAWLGPANSVAMYAVRYRAGGMSKAAFEAARSQWLGGEMASIQSLGEAMAPTHSVVLGTRTSPRERGFLWLDGYAAVAETREESEQALAARAEFEPLPPATRRDLSWELALGKVELLAGHPEDALDSLRRASAHCGALEFPMPHTRANHYLGLALEAQGDTVGACHAYAIVLARWGAARPPSQTAAMSLARSKALGCR